MSRIGLGTLPFVAPTSLWGDRAASVALLREAVAAGVGVIDTAWYYSNGEVNRVVRDALEPYAGDLLLVAKVGNSYDAVAREYVPVTEPAQIRRDCHLSARSLGLEAIPLLLLRWRADLPKDGHFDDAWQEVVDLRQQGLARDIGLSNVTMDLVVRAEELAHVSAVSNAFSLLDQSDDYVVDYCEGRGLLFIPYYPLGRGRVEGLSAIRAFGHSHGLTPQQVALGWLLQRSPCVVPIPGTASMAHLKSNLAAGDVALADLGWGELEHEVSTAERGGTSP